MTREHVLMILGLLVLLSPWSGLPLSWLEWVLPVIGLAIIGIALTLRRRHEPSSPTLPPMQIQTEEPKPRSSHIAFS